MDGNIKSAMLALFLGILHYSRVETTQDCASPQYLELGRTCTVICSFEKGFYGVYWYNSTDYQQDYPTIYLLGSVKGGDGFTTGIFDIYPNGSLLINNVSLAHDNVFVVTVLPSQRDAPIRINVLVVVVVTPLPPVPLIHECEGEWTMPTCFVEISTPLLLTCSINYTRPAIGLNWILRANGDKNVSFKLKKSTEGPLFNTLITTKVIVNNSFALLLFVCVADSPPGMLVRNESHILVQYGKLDWTNLTKIPKIFERFSQMELTCTEDQTNFLVWKKISTTMTKNILYAVVFEGTIAKRLDEDYNFGENNSLFLPRINLHHGGLYACVYSNGITVGAALYEVTAIVYPVPSYPVIEGCSKEQYCLLEVKYRGNLTCHVIGIFPDVQLEWKLHDFDGNIITFTNRRFQVKKKDDLFELSLTVGYEFKDLPRNKTTVECLAIGQNAEHFNLTRKIDLLLLNGLPTETAARLYYLWIVLIVGLHITTIVIGIYFIKQSIKGKRFRTTQNIEGAIYQEKMPMGTDQYSDNATQSPHQEKRDVFIHELREKYKDLYDGVRRVPYRKDEMDSVNSVYVECVIESLQFEGEGHRRRKRWKAIQSYTNVFTDAEQTSTRRILQGEHGYGKSILCLQVAYDWFHSRTYLGNVEILILLRLKQLSGEKSVYKAIKRYILPKDTTLNEDDIEGILKSCRSVLVILDGFDEFSDQDTNNESDIISIISRQMFQKCTVVITTRSSCIPIDLPPRTQIYRLRGFDENSRLNYIKKVVVDDTIDAEKIERNIMEVQVLSDMSQTPLFFAIFAHLIQENDRIRKVSFVTEVFNYIISAFHVHTRNQMVHENIVKYNLFEREHRALDKICFQSLSTEKQVIVWGKDEIIQKTSLEFYKQYVRIGILVEEVVTIDKHTPTTPSDTETKVEVRFLHKIFCEWYAAHYLSDHLKQHPEEKLEEFLHHVDPSSFQYVYRFACGLNIETAKTLIEYLPRTEGGVTCAILCIREQYRAIENFSKTNEYIFSQGLIISGHDSMFLQSSSMTLLEEARRKGMDVKSLCLYNCWKAEDNSALKTLSGLDLTPKIPVERLKLNLTNRKLTDEEAINILELLGKFSKLKYVKFGFCIPPRSVEKKILLEKLKSKGVKVKWRLYFHSPFYTLNLKTGKWERDPDKSKAESVPIPLTDADFEEIRMEHENAMTRETEEKCKNDVENGREILRIAGQNNYPQGTGTIKS